MLRITGLKSVAKILLVFSFLAIMGSISPVFSASSGGEETKAETWDEMKDEEPPEGFSLGVLPVILIIALGGLIAFNVVKKKKTGGTAGTKESEKSTPTKRTVSSEGGLVISKSMINKILGRKNIIEVVGVDITNESIIISQLNKTKSGIELQKLATAPTPQNAIRDGEIIDTSSVAGVIQELMEANQITATHAITTVSGQAIIIRTVQFPAMSPKELKEVVLHEAERYIPFPIEEVNIDFQTLREIEDEGISKVEVLLVAAQKQFINSYVETFVIAGLKLVAVDVASFAVARAISENASGAASSSEPVVLVLIRGETTDITVLQRGIPRFSRSIPIGSTSFIENIASNLSISLEEAIDVFDKVVVPIAGQSISDDPMIEMASNEIRTTLRELTTEIQRSLEYFQSQDMLRVQHLVLSGRGARMKNLDKHFSMNLGLDVEISNPISHIQFDQEKYSPQFLMDNASILATSIGLAKRGVETGV